MHLSRFSKKRKRNKIVNFSMTPEESIMLDSKVKMSGLAKQEYITESVLNNSVTTISNSKSFSEIKKILFRIYEKLTDNTTNAIIDEIDIYALKTVVEMIERLQDE
ncbi:plasmid mobilization protein [Campylobacter pinnipediorum]|uniref:plasmid mobilization protein n=1 Tax=Campylobacter pinnipediorum TaxID=1965231 RepID=UPI003AB098E6